MPPVSKHVILYTTLVQETAPYAGALVSGVDEGVTPGSNPGCEGREWEALSLHGPASSLHSTLRAVVSSGLRAGGWLALGGGPPGQGKTAGPWSNRQAAKGCG